MKPFARVIISVLSMFVWIPVSVSLTPDALAAGKTIGVIMTGDVPYYRDIHKAFIDEMNKQGFFKGKDIEIIVQKPVPDTMPWLNAARKLVAIDCDVIISYGTPATLTVMQQTSSIPIIFAGVYDPKAMGMTKKKATGMSSKVPVSTVIKNLKGISKFSKLGIVYSKTEKDTVIMAREVKSLEGKFGFQTVLFNVRDRNDAARIKNVDALFLTTSCSAMYCVNSIANVARRSKIPTATAMGGGENSGIILTIAADPREQGRGAAEMLLKFFEGTRLSALPVKHPKRVNMIINLKEATNIGIKIPFEILTAATKVIK